MNKEMMSKGERDEFHRLNRNTEKTLKRAAVERSARLRAEVEEQLSAIYPQNDPRWVELTEAARNGVKELDERLAEICRKAGIAPECRPQLNVSWYGRGESMFKERRDELRKRMYSRIEAIQQTAFTKIEQRCLDLQTRILAAGLSSEAANEFLQGWPTIEELMPAPDIKEVQKVLKTEPQRHLLDDGNPDNYET
jgi:hypothetical protein